MAPEAFCFSSRRRHTRLVSDWSSDVCSSDLGRDSRSAPGLRGPLGCLSQARYGIAWGAEIGRASCRERVWILVEDGNSQSHGEIKLFGVERGRVEQAPYDGDVKGV